MENNCIDCGGDISVSSLRCRRCHLRNLHKNDNPQLVLCPRCQKPMTPGSKLCWECYKRDANASIERYKWPDNLKENFKHLKKVLENIR